MVVDGKCYGYGNKEVNDRLDKIFGPMPTKEGGLITHDQKKVDSAYVLYFLRRHRANGSRYL